MASSIDPNVLVDNVPVDKNDLRANWGFARDEIEALQALALDNLVSIPSGQTFLTQATHFRKFLVCNTQTGPVELVLPTFATFPFNGLFAFGIVSSGNFEASVEVNPTDTGGDNLRGKSIYQTTALSDDKTFIGANTASGDETIFSIWRRGGLWVVNCPAGVRTNVGDDVSFSSGGGAIPDGSISTQKLANNAVTKAKLADEVGRYGNNNERAGNFNLVQTDEGESLIWTGSAGDVCSVLDAAEGSQFVIKRASADSGILQVAGTTRFDFENQPPSATFTINPGKSVTLSARSNSSPLIIDVVGN